MSLFASRNRKVPHIYNGALNPMWLDEAKHAAWAFAIGDIRPFPQRRVSRADLPDVDFSRAVPVAGKPSLLRRLVRWLRPERPAYLPDEWRVIRPASDLAEPVRPGENVISINRAA